MHGWHGEQHKLVTSLAYPRTPTGTALPPEFAWLPLQVLKLYLRLAFFVSSNRSKGGKFYGGYIFDYSTITTHFEKKGCAVRSYPDPNSNLGFCTAPV